MDAARLAPIIRLIWRRLDIITSPCGRVLGVDRYCKIVDNMHEWLGWRKQPNWSKVRDCEVRYEMRNA